MSDLIEKLNSLAHLTPDEIVANLTVQQFEPGQYEQLRDNPAYNNRPCTVFYIHVTRGRRDCIRVDYDDWANEYDVYWQTYDELNPAQAHVFENITQALRRTRDTISYDRLGFIFL